MLKEQYEVTSMTYRMAVNHPHQYKNAVFLLTNFLSALCYQNFLLNFNHLDRNGVVTLGRVSEVA